jgi:hypothetical protein
VSSNSTTRVAVRATELDVHRDFVVAIAEAGNGGASDHVPVMEAALRQALILGFARGAGRGCA